MNELDLFSTSHLLTVAICIASIIYIPKYFKNSSIATHNNLTYVIICIILINQSMDLYREGYMDVWKLGLPLHLCDFTSFAALIYLLTKKRDFFLFAFFFGISGAGIAILTPDTVYGFPYVGYIQNQVGHTAILMGVSYGIIIDNQRPYFRDAARMLGIATIILGFMYVANYLLGPPANYWFLVEKPIGDNITSFMRAEPFHIIDLYGLAIILVYLIYLPYYLKDRSEQ
jgi:hypothetical integral membrane protein (TIGR02206 family)